MREFVHTHVHTHYSLLDGLASPQSMVAAAKDAGMKHLALTDHGALYGAVDFYQAAQEGGIHPIIGLETYVAPRHRGLKDGKQDMSGYHLVLLAQNQTGYQNLIKLATLAQLEGFYSKPRIDRELLEKYNEGLIVTSACLSGELARAILEGEGDLTRAKSVAHWYDEMFPSRYWLELQDHGIPEQRKVNEGILELTRHMCLPLIASNDAHYVARQHSYTHDVLLCVQTGTKLDDPKRMKMDSAEFYLKSPDEMYALFGHVHGALENTVCIAEQCHVEMPFGPPRLPHFDVPGGYTEVSYLRHLADEGLHRRYGTITTEMVERLDYELGVIAQTGYAAYFLILEDIIRWAREQGIYVGHGRGSVVGSLAAYCLGLSNVEPLGMGLMFERFLNYERLSLPDIDTDFQDDRRGEVISYIISKYGADCVAQVSTFGTMALRAAIKDVGRVMGVPYADVDRASKDLAAGVGLGEIKARMPQVVEQASLLLGTKRHASTHAAGLVIAPEPLDTIVPLARVAKGGVEGLAATQYENEYLEKLGLIKMDMLGLSTLTVVQRTMANIQQTTGTAMHMDDIPLDDPAIYSLLSTGETTAIFQLMSDGMRRALRALRPTCLADVQAVVALYRPGPMEFIDEYVRRKNGQEPVTYLHPDLEPILKNTYGVIVYQDQVLLIARAIAGYSWGEADKLRKAMGKKLAKEMAAQEDKFISGVEDRGYPSDLAEDLWPLIDTFCLYGFNAAHAAAYATLACQTAWLKAHYPVQFMAANLSVEKDTPDKLTIMLSECRRLGISVVAPDLASSGPDFTPSADRILYGLGCVKYVGDKLMRAVIADRQRNGPYADLTDAISRFIGCGGNRRALESLAKAGALDAFGDRGSLVESVTELVETVRKAKSRPAVNLFGERTMPDLSLPAVSVDRQTILAWEKAVLGTYVSDHPLHGVVYSEQSGIVPIGGLEEGQRVTVGAQVTEVRVTETKKGTAMALLKLEDLSGTVDAVIFPKAWSGVQVEADALVLAQGSVEDRYGKLQIVVDRLAPLEDMMSMGDVTLDVRLPVGDMECVKRAYLLLCGSVGSQPVRVTCGGVQIPLPLVGVTPTLGLIAILADVLGEGAVVLS